MRTSRLLQLCLVLGLASTGCKKPVEQVYPTPVPTATPVPKDEVIAYTKAGSLWMAMHDGSNPRLLAEASHGRSYWLPAAAPDGTHWLVWVARQDGSQDVAKVDLSGKVTVLTEIGQRAQAPMKNLRLGNAPSYSPDGKRIAYSFNGNIWLMDSSGFNAETLIGDGASWSPSFSPDGKRLAYVNGRQGRYDLWVTALDDHDTYQVSDFTNFSAGRPQWSVNGQRIFLSRIQGDDSDVVVMLADTETPLADADVLTKDKGSAGAVLNPAGTRMLFSSSRADGVQWNLYSADVTGQNALQVTKDGGVSPAWMKVTTPVALPTSPPTAVPSAIPTAAAAPVSSAASASSAAPVSAAAAPAAVSKPAASTPASGTAAASAPAAAASPAASAAPTAVPSPAAAVNAVPSPAATAVATAAPSAAATAAPAAAKAPLILRLKASFDAAELNAADLEALKALVPKIKARSGDTVQVIGPLDNGPLKGLFASTEERSLSRAKIVAAALVKASGLPEAKVKAQPYSPPSTGGDPNSVLLYLSLKN